MLGEHAERLWQPYQQLAALPYLERPVAEPKGSKEYHKNKNKKMFELFKESLTAFRPQMPSTKPWRDTATQTIILLFLSPTHHRV